MKKTDITLLIQLMEKYNKPKPESDSPNTESQEHELAAMTFEETIEHSDEIAKAEKEHISEKFGDILFHLVFYARIAEEVEDVGMQKVIYDAVDRMAERHPHTFEAKVYTSEAEKEADLQRIKAQELAAAKDTKIDTEPYLSPLLKMEAIPPIAQSLAMQEQLATMGFDWSNADEVFDKIAEEIAEIKVEINAKDEGAAFEEYGDLMLAVINLGRKLSLDPDKALRKANLKFYRRSEAMIASVGSIEAFKSFSPEEQDTLWDAVKEAEKLTN